MRINEEHQYIEDHAVVKNVIRQLRSRTLLSVHSDKNVVLFYGMSGMCALKK